MIINKPKFWNNLNFISLMLSPLSLITLIITFLKKKIFKSVYFNIPVICVGNIYVGGTGKTPLSIHIFNILKKKFQPGIIRKYYESHLDEINLTKNKVKKIYYKKDRSKAILDASKDGRNIVILDDGFQDQFIHKDLSIICFNSDDLIGNGLLLPAGPLREPFTNISKAKIVVINGKKNKKFEEKIKTISKKVKIFYTEYILDNALKFRGKKILAFAGIGNPNSFYNLLRKNKLNLIKTINFPDHYNFKKEEVKRIIKYAKIKKLKVVTTEKDYYRLKLLGIKNINYISIKLKIHKEVEFKKELLKNI